ncbi:MAG: ribonuclease HII [Chloroflexi bacterium]|nr:ribonuclease HII [Chloroflexota bacterium]
MKSPPPTFRQEAALWRQGLGLVAGVDEVGRGPLAGPVAAGAVILPPRARFPWLRRVRDSKELPPNVREELAACIWRHALAVGIGVVPHRVIDDVGIVEATRQAMLQALGELSLWPEYVLIDAVTLPTLSAPQRAIIDGDARSRSIACASIVAKVARDSLMLQEDIRHHGYGFATNKGYGTPEHLGALRRLGPCDIHRHSFAPVREALEGRCLVAVP